MVRIYMFIVCLVLLLGISSCAPAWAAQPSTSYGYDAATHYDDLLDSDCQSTPPGCAYVALAHKTACAHSKIRAHNTGLFGILCWSSIIVVGYLSVSRAYDTSSNKFDNSPHRPNYDVRIELRCTSTTTLKNDMSQYRAYFVPGAVDPEGLQISGGLHGGVNSPGLPNYGEPGWDDRQDAAGKSIPIIVLMLSPVDETVVAVYVCQKVFVCGKWIIKSCKLVRSCKGKRPKKWGDLPDPDTQAYKDFCDPARGKNKWEPPEPKTPPKPKDNPNDGYDGWLEPPDWTGGGK